MGHVGGNNPLVELFVGQETEFQSRLAKTATIDGQWSTIGTANLDRLSLVGNYEINAEIVSPTVADALEGIFLTDLTNCREVDLAHWEQRSPVAKFTEGLLAPWRPIF